MILKFFKSFGLGLIVFTLLLSMMGVCAAALMAPIFLLPWPWGSLCTMGILVIGISIAFACSQTFGDKNVTEE